MLDEPRVKADKCRRVENIVGNRKSWAALWTVLLLFYKASLKQTSGSAEKILPQIKDILLDSKQHFVPTPASPRQLQIRPPSFILDEVRGYDFLSGHEKCKCIAPYSKKSTQNPNLFQQPSCTNSNSSFLLTGWFLIGKTLLSAAQRT